MRAAVMRGGRIIFDAVPDPVPGDGQVLGKALANASESLANPEQRAKVLVEPWH